MDEQTIGLIELLKQTLSQDNDIISAATSQILERIRNYQMIELLFNILFNSQDQLAITLAYLYLYKSIKIQWNYLDQGKKDIIQFNLLEILERMPDKLTRQKIFQIITDIIYYSKISFKPLLDWLITFTDNIDVNLYKLLSIDSIFTELPDDFIYQNCMVINEVLNNILQTINSIDETRIKLIHLHALILSKMTDLENQDESFISSNIQLILTQWAECFNNILVMEHDFRILLISTLGLILNHFPAIISDIKSNLEEILTSEDIEPNIKFTLFHYVLSTISTADVFTPDEIDWLITGVFFTAVEMVRDENVKEYITIVVDKLKYVPDTHLLIHQKCLECLDCEDFDHVVTAIRFINAAISTFFDSFVAFRDTFLERVFPLIEEPNDELDDEFIFSSLPLVSYIVHTSNDLTLLSKILWMCFTKDDIRIQFGEALSEILREDLDMTPILAQFISMVNQETNIDGIFIQLLSFLVQCSYNVTDGIAAFILQLFNAIYNLSNQELIESVISFAGSCIVRVLPISNEILGLIQNDLMGICQAIANNQNDNFPLYIAVLEMLSNVLQNFPGERNILLDTPISEFLAHLCEFHFEDPYLEVYALPIRAFYIIRSGNFLLVGDLLNDLNQIFQVRNYDALASIAPALSELAKHITHTDTLNIVSNGINAVLMIDEPKHQFNLSREISNILLDNLMNNNAADFDAIIDPFIGSFIDDPNSYTYVPVLQMIKFGLLRSRGESLNYLVLIKNKVLPTLPDPAIDSFLEVLIDLYESEIIFENFLIFVAETLEYTFQRDCPDTFQNAAFLLNIILFNDPNSLDILGNFAEMTIGWLDRCTEEAKSNIASLMATIGVKTGKEDAISFALENFPPTDVTEVNRMMANLSQVQYTPTQLPVLRNSTAKLIQEKENYVLTMDEELFNQFVQFVNEITSQ